MKAWLSHAVGDPESLVLDDIPVPEAGDGQVCVRVGAVGINFPDLLVLRDQYQVKPPRPFSPGGEFSGVVEHLGPGSARFRPGDAVVGVCGWGALREFLVIDEAKLVKLSAEIPPSEAAAFLFTYATAYYALFDRASMHAHETVLILGAAGGVGSAAIELAKSAGARVIVGVSSQAKLDFALAAGADAGLVYRSDMGTREDQKSFAEGLKALSPNGIDIVLDPVGGSLAEPALRCLARGGRYLVVGFAAGVSSIPLNLVLLRSCHIIGVDWGTFTKTDREGSQKIFARLFDLWAAGKIAPTVTEIYPFGSAPSAIKRLESRDVMGKIVVRHSSVTSSNRTTDY